ncbi:Uncharacterised protein [Salmonella enterica subsp. enterica]|nr:Uncharacterised protein [Salmonella enterica subsp. enterica]
MLKPQAARSLIMCNNFPSGSALPGTGFSTHKRRQDKCGTGNSNGRSVAASQGTTRCSAPAETAAPARAGETCSSQSPGLIQADHRFSASLNRTHIPVASDIPASLPGHGAGILSRFAPIAIRDDQSVSHAMTSGVILLARLLSVLLLLRILLIVSRQVPALGITVLPLIMQTMFNLRI